MSWFKNWWNEVPLVAKVTIAIGIVAVIVFFLMSHTA